jgi:hypothetical protein
MKACIFSHAPTDVAGAAHLQDHAVDAKNNRHTKAKGT